MDRMLQQPLLVITLLRLLPIPWNLLGHNYIGSEHLLPCLLREGEGVAARVLENLGADPNNIRTQASVFALFFMCRKYPCLMCNVYTC